MTLADLWYPWPSEDSITPVYITRGAYGAVWSMAQVAPIPILFGSVKPAAIHSLSDLTASGRLLGLPSAAVAHRIPRSKQSWQGCQRAED